MVDKNEWGKIIDYEDEYNEADNASLEDEDSVMEDASSGIQSQSTLDIQSDAYAESIGGISSVPQGLETPESIELVKNVKGSVFVSKSVFVKLYILLIIFNVYTGLSPNLNNYIPLFKKSKSHQGDSLVHNTSMMFLYRPLMRMIMVSLNQLTARALKCHLTLRSLKKELTQQYSRANMKIVLKYQRKLLKKIYLT